MLDKELGKDIKIDERADFLRDNCDAVEEIEYSKAFSPVEMAEWIERLANCDLQIDEIEEEKAEVQAEFKERLKPLKEEHAECVRNVRNKACNVKEQCYKFFDDESKMVGYYNSEGNLIYSRPAMPSEMGHSMFSMKVLKTGTND